MSTAAGIENDDAISRRGAELFERQIRPRLGSGDQDKFVAIDVESGDFELDDDDFAATERLVARQPRARIWLMRVGQDAAYRIGGSAHRGEVE